MPDLLFIEEMPLPAGQCKSCNRDSHRWCLLYLQSAIYDGERIQSGKINIPIDRSKKVAVFDVTSNPSVEVCRFNDCIKPGFIK